MIHIFKYAAFKAWSATLVLFVLFGLLVTAARLLLPLLSDYRVQVEDLISRTTGLVARIGDAQARLDGLTPRLMLTDISLKDPSGESLELERVQVDLDLFETLISGQIRLDEGTLVGARVQLIREVDGTLMLRGLEGLRFPRQGTRGGLLLLQLDGLRLIDSEITWEDRLSGKAPLTFSDLHILIANSHKGYRLSASARLPEVAASIQLFAELVGDIREPDSFSGDFYLKAKGLDLARLIADPVLGGYSVRSGVLDTQLWGRLRLGQLIDLKGSVALDGAKFEKPSAPGVQPLRADRLEGGLEWGRQPQGWLLEVRDLTFAGENRGWPGSAFSVRFDGSELADWRLQAGFKFFRLEDLVPLMASFTEESGALKALAPLVQELQPQGEVHGLQVNLQRGDSGLNWSARGQLSGFATQSWAHFPGLSGLDFDFRAGQQQGAVRITARDAALNFPQLFRETLQIDTLAGDLTWHFDREGGLVIETPMLNASNRDIKTLTRLYLHLPSAGSPWLDLQTDFRDLELATAHPYFPVAVMKEGLRDWMERSLVSGRVHSGSVLLRGALEDFPFLADEGRFEVMFDVDDLILDYKEHWPRLEEAVADIRFLNNGMSFELHDGFLLESRVLKATGGIEAFVGHTDLSLDAVVIGPFQDDLRIVRETPLAARYGKVVESLQAQGLARTQVKLLQSLEPDKTTRVSGSLSWKEAGLQLDKLGISLARLGGRLDYSQHGLNSTGVRARVFDKPITLDLETVAAEQGQPVRTRISARGEWEAGELAQHLPPVGLQYVKGPLAVELTVDLPHGTGGLTAKADVDLAQAAVDLPEPLGKPAGEQGRLWLELQRRSSAVTDLRLLYAERAAALLRFGTEPPLWRLDLGNVRIGGAAPEWPESQGLWLDGAVERLDLDAWRDWLQGQVPLERVSKGDQPLLRGVDLEMEELRFGGRPLHQVSVNLERGRASWEGWVSSDLLAGSFSLPDDYTARPLEVRLSYLDLARLDYGESTQPETAPVSGERALQPDPRQLPGLDLTIDQVRKDKLFIGRLGLACQRIPDGLEMRDLSLKGPKLEVNGRGSWVVQDRDQRTEVSVSAGIDPLGAFLREMGYSSLRQDGPSKVRTDLQWQGGPQAFSLAGVVGGLRMDVGEGRLLEVSPGVGRVFGLLNLGALQRRLTLDFSDLFKKGFTFDKLKGVFDLRQGNAWIEEAFIEGPAARIDFEGRTGLVAKDYDQTITVTPRVISGSLPVAGVLTGGPLVGAALLVAQQVMGKQVDRISRYSYALTGSWDDPTLTKQPKSWSQAALPAEPASDEVETPVQEPSSPISEYLDH